jgi:lysophospholipase L1-like esterase
MSSNSILFALYTSWWYPFKPTWVGKTADPLKNVKGTSIVMFGDSTTAYVDYKAFPYVVNLGIGGDTSNGVRARVSVPCSQKPRRVCLGIGANDLQGGQLDPNKEWFFQWQKNYIAILEEIREEAPSAQIVLSTPLPVDRRFEKYGSTMKDGLQLMRSAVLGLAPLGFGIVDLYSALAQPDGYVAPGLFTDYIHPDTAEAQAAIKAAYGTILA